jgi:hypothetical protein
VLVIVATNLKPAIGVRALISFSQFRESLHHLSPIRKCYSKWNCQIALAGWFYCMHWKVIMLTVTSAVIINDGAWAFS